MQVGKFVSFLVPLGLVLAGEAPAAQQYHFKVANKTSSDITTLQVSVDKKTWGKFDVGDGVKAGETETFVWDESTNDEPCEEWIRAKFSDGEWSRRPTRISARTWTLRSSSRSNSRECGSALRLIRYRIGRGVPRLRPGIGTRSCFFPLRQSCRSASTGASRDARNAGTALAITPVANNASATAASTKGSRGATP